MLASTVIDLAIITRGELSLGRTIYPGTIHPGYTMPFTIDLAIKTRGIAL